MLSGVPRYFALLTECQLKHFIFCRLQAFNIHFSSKPITPKGVAMYTTSSPAKCDDKKNSAFVFIKPHANTTATQNLVQATLKSKGITIRSEGELTAAQIDKGPSLRI